MIHGPRYHYRVLYHPSFEHLEPTVPGAWLYGWDGRKWRRPKAFKDEKGDWTHDPYQLHWDIQVSWDRGWLLSQHLEQLGHLHDIYPVDITDHLFVTDEEWHYAYGKTLIEAAANRGELSEEAVRIATTYQTRASSMGYTKPKIYNRWSGGGGKSGGFCYAASSRQGAILLLCPASARKSWRWRPEHLRPRNRRIWSAVERFTTWESYIILPESERAKAYEPLHEYWARMVSDGRRPFVIGGLESLNDHADEILRYPWDVIGIDEAHTLGSHKRVDGVSDELGNTKWYRAKTEKGEDLRVLAADRVLSNRHTSLRVAFSGTPIDKSIRRLWSQGDLLQKGSQGPYSAFRIRYCDYHKTEDGRWDDSGASRVDELRAVWSFWTSDLPRSVTHRELPPFEPSVVYLYPPDRLDVPEEERQNRPDAFTAEIKHAVKTGGNVREVKLAEACSRSRRATLRKCEETINGGGKVIVFLSRIEMVRQWETSFRKFTCPGWAVTGETPDKERDRIIDEFAGVDGAAWFLATGQSVGTSKDGMQCADLLVIAQVPEKVGDFLQWMWRVDRIGGVGTEVWIPVALGTQAEVEVARIQRALGPIEKFTNSPELRDLADRFDGGEFESVLAGVAGTYGGGGGEGPEME